MYTESQRKATANGIDRIARALAAHGKEKDAQSAKAHAQRIRNGGVKMADRWLRREK